jgi:hypothetical protein
MSQKSPEVIVSEFLLTALRGLRFSDNPEVAAAAARREKAEKENLDRIAINRRPQRLAA